MSATMDPWVTEAVDLRNQGLSERQIAEAVGKAPSTVHSALKKAEETPIGTVGPELAEQLRQSAESNGDSSGVIPGQTSVDDHLPPSEEPPPEDDPEYEPPAQDPPRNDGPPPEEIVLSGPAQLGFFDAGGKRPQSASIRFVGGKVLLSHGTAYKKGDVIHFSGTAVVNFVGQQDKTDASTGIVVDCEQQHKAKITDLRVG